jgi:hypothetical protein
VRENEGRLVADIQVTPQLQRRYAKAACRVLADKNVSTLRRDFGIDVTDPICSHDGQDTPAPDFRELVD